VLKSKYLLAGDYQPRTLSIQIINVNSAWHYQHHQNIHHIQKLMQRWNNKTEGKQENLPYPNKKEIFTLCSSVSVKITKVQSVEKILIVHY